MKCKNCGAEIDDKSKFCPYCGDKVGVIDAEFKDVDEDKSQNTVNNNYTAESNLDSKDNKTIAILALIFGILGGVVGIILGAIGLSRCKEKNNRTMCILGIVFGALSIIGYTAFGSWR